MKKQTFGQAKPLPGQPGYRMTDTDILEREAKEMETRLKLLQERMKQDEEKSPPPTENPSGNKWKSAREDKGSIRSYAKDVQEKIKTKSSKQALDISLPKASAKARRATREAETSGNYRAKSIDKWTVADVSDWLAGMMLEQYVQVFRDNDISGTVILDISLEDLDYMGITILGHRKVILKAIEDLRKNKRVTMDLTAGSPSSKPSQGNTTTTTTANSGQYFRTTSESDIQKSRLESKSFDGLPTHRSQGGDNAAVASERRAAPVSTAAASLQHWSEVTPLSRNKVTNEAQPVNLADGTIDEAAEREAFQRAVMEWRNAQKKDEEAVVHNKQSNDNMWNDPFVNKISDLVTEDVSKKSLAEGELDEEEERRAFQRAVQEWRDAKPDNQSTSTTAAASNQNSDRKNASARPQSKSSAVGISSDKIVSSQTGAVRPSERHQSLSLGDGILDEAKEHEEFRKAVDAWRSGSSSRQPENSKKIAEKLFQDMEQEHDRTAAKIQQQQELARIKLLEANRNLQEIQIKAKLTSVTQGNTADDHDVEDIEEQDFDWDDDYHETKYTNTRNSNTQKKKSEAEDIEKDFLLDRPLSPASSLGDDSADEHQKESSGKKNNIEVSLVESRIGFQDDLAESFYDVDEASTDDDEL